MTNGFPKISLRHRHAPMVVNAVFSHKRDFITVSLEILNLTGHQSYITGTRVTATFLNRRIFPFGQSGEASWWRVCHQWGLPRVVYTTLQDSKGPKDLLGV